MKTATISRGSQQKRSVKKAAGSALATCPVNGAGWCPYPFSPEQLMKHLKQKYEASYQNSSDQSKKRPIAKTKAR